MPEPSSFFTPSTGHWRGVVTTVSGEERTFSGTLDLRRVVEDVRPPAGPSFGDLPTPRWSR